MLGKGRAVELMDAIGSEVRRLIEPGAGAPDALRLERIADAIVSIEYYMETLQNGRADPWYMLDNAEICLKALAADDEPRVPDLELAPADAAKTLKLDPEDTLAREERAKRAQAATHPLIAVVAEAEVDPQFLELFIEEAKEEIASIQQSFPLWDQNPMDLEALASLRRSFHTLKGSGRMVGARTIAEFGWAIENLLNRIIDKTLSRTPGHDDLVSQLPSRRCRSWWTSSRAAGKARCRWTRSCRVPSPMRMAARPSSSGRPWHRRIASTLRHRGRRIRGGQVPRRRLQPRRPLTAAAANVARLAPAAPARAPAAAPMDPQLHEIYSKETSSHLAEIREYLRKRTGLPAPHDLPESVYRAIHTLSGSSKMAEARHGIRITEPLNHFMRKVFDSGRGLSDAGLVLLADAVRAIDNVVAHINETTAFFSEQPSLLGRLRELETELDAELAAQAANDTSASAIVRALPRICRGGGERRAIRCAAAPPPLRCCGRRARSAAPPRPRSRARPARARRRLRNSITRSPISTAKRRPSSSRRPRRRSPSGIETARTSSGSPSCSANCIP